MLILKLIDVKIASINSKYNRNFSLTKQYREFKELVYYNALNIKLEPNYKITIYIKTYKDIDNFIKPCIDALQERGVITNDKFILELIIKKEPIKKCKPESIEIHIEGGV